MNARTIATLAAALACSVVAPAAEPPAPGQNGDLPQPAAAPGTVAPGTRESEQRVLPLAESPPQSAHNRARALRLDDQGFVVGTVSSIDPTTLEVRPIANAVVTFMQELRIVAQARSGPDGGFALKGPTARATYSVFIRSPKWVCMFAAIIEPADHVHSVAASAVDEKRTPARTAAFPRQAAGTRDRWVLFAAEQERPAAEPDPRFIAIQAVPFDDFYSAVQQGLFGDLGGVPGTLPGSPPGVTGGLGGGGGGGGGALEAAALGAAAGAAGMAVGAASGDNPSRGPPASPFTP